MAKITYTCSSCQLRFLASDDPSIFPTYQRDGDKYVCLLCTQLKPAEIVMAKAKKGPSRKESKKDKIARKAQEAVKKSRMRRGSGFVPPTENGEW